VPNGSPPKLIGRAREREAIADALDALSARPGVVVIEGEPGIGKSRLLEHLGASAGGRGCTVLDGRASEFEADLPHALWTDALDGHLARAGDRALARLGLADPAALAASLPALSGVAGEAMHADRHRAHRALRDLLERLAGARPVVLCLDDVHWADPASVDALAALVRRPPAGRVLLAMATRERQLPPALAAAVGDAAREDRLTLLDVAPLSREEAVELVGEAGAALYAWAGGNPFYLEQLARMSGDASPGARDGEDASVRGAVARARDGGPLPCRRVWPRWREARSPRWPRTAPAPGVPWRNPPPRWSG
jgi:predicted ATPase